MSTNHSKLEQDHKAALKKLQEFSEDAWQANIWAPSHPQVSLVALLREHVVAPHNLEWADTREGAGLQALCLRAQGGELIQWGCGLPHVEPAEIAKLQSEPGEWITYAQQLMPVQDYSRLLLLEWLRGIAFQDSERLKKVANSFKPTQFVWLVWQGFYEVQKMALHSHMESPALHQFAKEDFPALKVGDVWDHVLCRDAKQPMENWTQVSEMPNTKIKVQARFVWYEYLLPALFDYSKHKDDRDWLRALAKYPDVTMNTKNLGLKNALLPSPEKTVRPGSSLHRLGGLLFAMGSDSLMQRKGFFKKPVPPSFNKNSKMEGTMTRVAYPKATLEMATRAHLNAQIGEAGTRYSSAPQQGLTRLELESEWVSEEADVDDPSEQGWSLVLRDRSHSKFTSWQSGSALLHLDGFSLLGVVWPRDRQTLEIRGQPLWGSCLEWGVQEDGTTRWLVDVQAVPEGHPLHGASPSTADFEYWLVDLREQLGEPFYMLVIVAQPYEPIPPT